MVQKVSSSIPQGSFSSLVPKNPIVRLVLVVLGGIVIIQIAKSLIGRVFSSEYVRNSEANKCCELGSRYVLQSEFKEAERHYHKALSWNPSDSKIKATIYLGLGSLIEDPKESIDSFKTSLSFLTDSTDDINEKKLLFLAYENIGKKCGSLGEFTLALGNLEKAHSELEALEGQLFLGALTSRSSPKDVPSILALIKTWKTGILFSMCDVYCHMRLYKQAMEKCLLALALKRGGEKDLNALLVLANICDSQENQNQSIEYLGLALNLLGEERGDQYVSVLVLRAKAYHRLGNYEKCLEDFDAALQCSFSIADLKAEILLDRRDVYLARKNPDAAAQDLKLARDCAPTEPSIRDTVNSLCQDYYMDSAD